MSKIDSLIVDYGEFTSTSQAVEFDSEDVPKDLWPLMPYARFWGIADDLERENSWSKLLMI